TSASCGNSRRTPGVNSRRESFSIARTRGGPGGRTPSCTSGWPMPSRRDRSRSANQRKPNMRFRLERWTCAVGRLLLATDENGLLRGLEFEENESRLRRLLRRYYGDIPLEEAAAPDSLKRALSAYFDGDIDALRRIETAMPGTAFQRAVWTALRAIPAGTTISYGQLAATLGRKGASRAVGAANGA